MFRSISCLVGIVIFGFFLNTSLSGDDYHVIDDLGWNSACPSVIVYPDNDGCPAFAETLCSGVLPPGSYTEGTACGTFHKRTSILVWNRVAWHCSGGDPKAELNDYVKCSSSGNCVHQNSLTLGWICGSDPSSVSDSYRQRVIPSSNVNCAPCAE